MLKVEIVTPERIVHTTSGEEVLLPTIEGTLGIRKGHMPLITLLSAGEIVVKRDGREDLYAVQGGFVEILGNVVRVLADSAEREDELDEQRIRQAIERAQVARAGKGEQVEGDAAIAALEANLARLKVFQRRKKRR